MSVCVCVIISDYGYDNPVIHLFDQFDFFLY